MPIVANNTTILFNDSTTQTTAGASGVNTVTVANSPGTWTKPASVKSIKVTVVGGGGDSAPATYLNGYESYYGASNPGGGGGGGAIKYYPAASLPGPQPYTSGGPGATSSFGAAPIGPISATGGSGINGGIGSGGTIVNARGGSGTWGAPAIGLNNNVVYGVGGSSILGGGTPTNTNADSTSYGSGAGGTIHPAGNAGSTPGRSGAPGAVIIEEFN